VILGVEALGNERKSPHIIVFYSHRGWQALAVGKRSVWDIKLLYYCYQHDKGRFIYIFYKIEQKKSGTLRSHRFMQSHSFGII